MNRDPQVGWHGPRSRGPDNDRPRFSARIRSSELIRHVPNYRFRKAESDPDRDRNVNLVLDFGLSQRGLERDAPVYGLLAPVNEAAGDERGKGADDVSLERGRLRLVFVGPVGEDPESLELRRLLRDPLFGKCVAPGAQFGRGEGQLLLLNRAGNPLLDRQSMAVPARDVGRLESTHGLVPVDQFLEDLVQRGAHVDIVVRERRAIVQHVSRATGALALDGVVEPDLLPVGHAAGFTLRQRGAHREIRPRKLQCIFQVLSHAGQKGARVGWLRGESRRAARRRFWVLSSGFLVQSRAQQAIQDRTKECRGTRAWTSPASTRFSYRPHFVGARLVARPPPMRTGRSGSSERTQSVARTLARPWIALL